MGIASNNNRIATTHEFSAAMGGMPVSHDGRLTRSRIHGATWSDGSYQYTASVVGNVNYANNQLVQTRHIDVRIVQIIQLPPPEECPEGNVPICPFPDTIFDTFFPHPNDNQWFFHCKDGVAYCKQCPADLVWNIDLDTCDWEYS
jgi:hypothetical protein